MWKQAQEPEAQALSADVLRIATQAQTTNTCPHQHEPG